MRKAQAVLEVHGPNTNFPLWETGGGSEFVCLIPFLHLQLTEVDTSPSFLASKSVEIEPFLQPIGTRDPLGRECCIEARSWGLQEISKRRQGADLLSQRSSQVQGVTRGSCVRPLLLAFVGRPHHRPFPTLWLQLLPNPRPVPEWFREGHIPLLREPQPARFSLSHLLTLILPHFILSIRAVLRPLHLPERPAISFRPSYCTSTNKITGLDPPPPHQGPPCSPLSFLIESCASVTVSSEVVCTINYNQGVWS